MRRVIVVGGGVVGLCVADALLDRNFEVVLVDREARPGEGCSFGNGGIVVPSHFVPLSSPGMVATGLRMLLRSDSPFGLDGIPGPEVLRWCLQFWRVATRAHVARCAPVLRDLNVASREIYARMVSEMDVDFGFEQNGILMLCRTERAFAEEKHTAVTASSLGLKAEVLDPGQLAKREPGMTMNAIGGVYFHDDAHLTPSQFMAELRRRVILRGAEVFEGVEVTAVREARGLVTGLDARSAEGGPSAIRGDDYVLAAGVWTTSLVRGLGRRMPMLAGKGYGLTVKYPPERPTTPSFLIESRVAMTPMLDGVRFVGTMELGRPNARKNSSRIEGFKNSIANYYPKFTADVLRRAPVWYGLRPCPPDGMPYLGRLRGISNLYVATGHGMMGMSLGPISGQLMAELLSRQDPSIPLALMDPNRHG